MTRSPRARRGTAGLASLPAGGPTPGASGDVLARRRGTRGAAQRLRWARRGAGGPPAPEPSPPRPGLASVVDALAAAPADDASASTVEPSRQDRHRREREELRVRHEPVALGLRPSGGADAGDVVRDALAGVVARDDPDGPRGGEIGERGRHLPVVDVPEVPPAERAAGDRLERVRGAAVDLDEDGQRLPRRLRLLAGAGPAAGGPP